MPKNKLLPLHEAVSDVGVVMLLPQFKLEEYFAKYEFVAPFMMGSSDPETYTLGELVAMADEECLSLWNNLRFSYTETHGLPLLREEIKKLYSTQEKDKIVVFSGAEEAIYILFQVLLKPGDEVVVLTPCYQSLKEIPKAQGARMTEVSLDWENNTWSFNLEKFKNALTKQTKLVILNFPHNPTGYQPSPALFKEMVELVKKQGSYLFSDEVYRLSEQNPADCLPNAVDCYEKAISLGVMSKSFGFPGLRIGWVAAHDKKLLSELCSYKNYTSICNSAPSEILALMALRNQKQILQRNRDIAKKNLDLLDSFFERYPSIYEWYRPKAGFINFPRLKLEATIDEFTKDLIAEEGVIILPGTLFDNPNNHFRLGFGRHNLPEALSRLERFTQKFV
jgi:aspartate/methionine/tyrosine aminotransferase